MKTKKMYYHVIEDCGYGRLGHHGFYTNLDEAKKQADKLNSMFDRSFFYVHPDTSKKEPPFITI